VVEPYWLAEVTGTSSTDIGKGISVDSQKNVYVVCESNNASGLNSGLYLNTNMYLMKYNSSGVLQWTRIIGSTGTENVYACKVDSNDQIYVLGKTTTNYSSTGGNDSFAAKFQNNSATDIMVVRRD
jgi:hypothetical protein